MALKKFTASDFNLKTDNLPAEQKSFMENIVGMMCDVMNKSLEGVMTPDDVETKFKGLNDILKVYDNEKFNQLVKDNEELIEQVKTLGESIEKMKQKGINFDAVDNFTEKFDEMVNSPKFLDFLADREKSSGFFEFSLKDLVSTSNSYEGEVLISHRRSEIASKIAENRHHMRDFLSVEQGDPGSTNHTWLQITEVDRNARFVTENGMLPKSAIKMREKSTNVKRVGTMMDLSKRMLKRTAWLRSWLLNHVANWVYMAEDSNILFGDGTGENLEGITTFYDCESIEGLLSHDIVTGEAGSILSVKGANSNKDTVIEFKNPQFAIRDGMVIIFTGATDLTELNNPHEVIKQNDRVILLRGVEYKEESTIENLAFTVKHKFFKNIPEPNPEDAIRTAFALATFNEFSPNAVVFSPSTVNSIMSLKDTTGRPLDLIKVRNGIKYIAERPIIELPQMLDGKYLIGDFYNGASLIQYTNIAFNFKDDVNYEAQNMIALLIQEELLLAVICPFAFSYGDLDKLIETITKK